MTDKPGGIVPPYLEAEWRNLRSDLQACATITQQAASMATTEDVRPLLQLALTQLTDASFWLMHIERDASCEPLEGMET